MRAILTGALRSSTCRLCGSPVTEEEHRTGFDAQRVTWWVPVPHAAGCGRPCIAGGVEAHHIDGRPTFDHAHRADRCGDEDCGGGASYQLPGLLNPVVWRAHRSDGSTRVFEVRYYIGPNTSRSWFAAYGDGWTPDSLRTRSLEGEIDAARQLAAKGAWCVERFERDVTGYLSRVPGNIPPALRHAQPVAAERAAEILRGMRIAPRMYGTSPGDVASFAQGVLATVSVASSSANAWSAAVAAVLRCDGASVPPWDRFSYEDVVRVAEHAARSLGVAVAPSGPSPQASTTRPRYRIVTFLADPFTGAQFPVGAIIATHGDEEAHFVEAPRMPDAAYLGERGSRLLALVLLCLRAVKTLYPRSVAPTVYYGAVREFPVGVAPDAWIIDHLAGGRRA